MKPDPLIDQIRHIRHQLSAEIGHDPRRLLEYYAEIQNRYRGRLVDHGGSKKPPTSQTMTPEISRVTRSDCG